MQMNNAAVCIPITVFFARRYNEVVASDGDIVMGEDGFAPVIA
jgi:hypothetical protein